MRKNIFLFILFFTAIASEIFACQACTLTFSIIFFRFLPVWVGLYLVWTAAACFADASLYNRTHSFKDSFVHTKSMLKVFGLAVVMLILGLSFIAFFVFPFVILRYNKLLKRSGLNEKQLALKKNTPGWLIIFSVFMQICLFVTMIGSYFIFPAMINEPMARPIRIKLQKKLSQIGEIFNSQNSIPEYIEINSEGKKYYTIDPNSLSDISGKDEDLFEDAFGIKAGTYRLYHIYLGIDYPATFGGKQDFSRFQYYKSGKNYILWSRGPDYDFDFMINKDEITTDTLRSFKNSAIRINYSYDPTNGTFSNGDIFRSGEEK